MLYQFQVDNRPAGPLRELWSEAVTDAVNDGYAVWVGPQTARMFSDQGAAIARVPSKEGQP